MSHNLPHKRNSYSHTSCPVQSTQGNCSSKTASETTKDVSAFWIKTLLNILFSCTQKMCAPWKRRYSDCSALILAFLNNFLKIKAMRSISQMDMAVKAWNATPKWWQCSTQQTQYTISGCVKVKEDGLCWLLNSESVHKTQWNKLWLCWGGDVPHSLLAGSSDFLKSPLVVWQPCGDKF